MLSLCFRGSVSGMGSDSNACKPFVAFCTVSWMKSPTLLTHPSRPILWKSFKMPRWINKYFDFWHLSDGWKTIFRRDIGIKRLKRPIPIPYHPYGPFFTCVGTYGRKEQRIVALALPQSHRRREFRWSPTFCQSTTYSRTMSLMSLEMGFGLHVTQTKTTTFCYRLWL